RQMRGYVHAGPDAVAAQVKALYDTLKQTGLAYVNSAIDYGAPASWTTQRTRLPRESLAAGSANCLDGTVLLASLIEGASLDPAIVLLSGHALVGWYTGDDGVGADGWRFLDVTLLADSDFEAACQKGEYWYSEFRNYYRDRLKLLPLSEL